MAAQSVVLNRDTVRFSSFFCPILTFHKPHSDQSVQSATGLDCHFCVRAEAQVSYVTERRICMRGELRLAGMSVSVSRLDNGLPQAGDPLLLAEGVIGLQAVGVSFRPPSAAHTETVLH